MNARLKKLGIVIAALGLVFIAGGVFAYTKVQGGDASLQAFAAAQNVNLSYNEEGELVDRGETEGAQAILSLLKDDWKYPVVESELDPNDPLVNTGTEYMYQMATVTYHTPNGSTTVTLPEGSDDVEYNGVTYEAGDKVEFQNDGKYWSDFDRTNPIEGPARAAIWTGTAHAIIAELGVGAVTASTLQLGLGVAAFMAGVGATLILLGLGLVWVARPVKAAEAMAPAKVETKKAKG